MPPASEGVLPGGVSDEGHLLVGENLATLAFQHAEAIRGDKEHIAKGVVRPRESHHSLVRILEHRDVALRVGAESEPLITVAHLTAISPDLLAGAESLGDGADRCSLR